MGDEKMTIKSELVQQANVLVSDCIADLQARLDTALAERDTAWQQLREIREAVSAGPNESTADVVRLLMNQRNELIQKLIQAQP